MGKTIRGLLILVLLAGCKGISPVAREIHTEGREAVKRAQAGYDQLLELYLRDVGSTLRGWADDAVDRDLGGGKGTIESKAALAAVEKYRQRLKGIEGKLARVRTEAQRNHRNFKLALEAGEDVDSLLQALEERRKAEDLLRAAAVRAAKEGAKAAAKKGAKGALTGGVVR